MKINTVLLLSVLFLQVILFNAVYGEDEPAGSVQPVQGIGGNIDKRSIRVGFTSIQSFFISFPGADDLKAKDIMSGVTVALANYLVPNFSVSFTTFLNSKIRFFYADLGSYFWWCEPSNIFNEFTFSGFNLSMEYYIPLMKSVRPFFGIEAINFNVAGNDSSKLIVDDIVFPSCGIVVYLADEFTVQAKLYSFRGEIKKATYKGELNILTYPAEFNYNSVNLNILYNVRF